MCSGELATLDNIAARTRGESSSCYFCQSNSESSLHLFRDCSVAKWVWNAIGLEWDGEGTEMGVDGDVRGWVEDRWRVISAEDYGGFMIGCWAIWEHMNKVVFEGVRVEPDRVVQRVKDIIQEGDGSVGTNGGRRRGRVEGAGDREHEGWKPASEGVVKINVDAGVKEGEGVGTGVVCRDDRGMVRWGLTIVRDMEWEPRFAEAIAVLDGLQEAQTCRHRRVVLESDCLQVIDALLEKRKGRSSFLLLVDDILSLCSSFDSVVWSHTSRINNSVAHALAHVLPRVVGKTVWPSLLPSVANSAAEYDLSVMN
ncbi:uncharacterized protein LOC141653226 [Silene latifolia]|uniref:uncharacterized protein LOC141653226 n=1 Tax=Silene latifolia TaxID=37657 RepID=UPI003D787C82